MNKSNQKHTLLVGALLLFALSGLSLIHLAGGIGNFIRVIVEINYRVLVAMVFLLLADIVRGVRLVALSKSMNKRVGLLWAVVSRLVGRFFGILTPAYSGSTPARAAVIAAETGMHAGTAFGLATLESLFDTFLPITITLILTIPLLPRTWLPFLTSLFLGLMWIGGIAWAKTEKFTRFIERRFGGKSYTCYLLRQRDLFLESLSSIVKDRFIIVVGGTLTLMAHLLETFSIMILSPTPLTPLDWNVLWSLWRSFLALEISNVMVMSPTPGGALFFEYGLAGVLDPETLIGWRITYILFSLIPGFLLILITGRMRKYLEHVVEEEVRACDRG